IYRIGDTALRKSAAIHEVRALLAEGFAERAVPQLVKLLEHPDMRIRQEAQFALAAKKGEEARQSALELRRVTKEDKSRVARLHAIWALGQLFRRRDLVPQPPVSADLVLLLRDSDMEIRAQAARTIGDSNGVGVAELIPLLKDGEPRVRLQAALALGRR